ncbi:MAG TPA: SCP-like extracellular [Leucothrix sp.]|nr:SCP-like extracellular [Leucothrix sp.]
MKNKLLPFIFITLLLLNASSYASEQASLASMVNLHNEIRSEKSQEAIKWSASLAHYAQQWVNHLATTKNCEMQHRPEAGKFQQIYGENLFWSSASETGEGIKSFLNFSAKDVVAAWAVEEDFYDYQKNECEFGKICGHYTQIVWHETKEVGCAIAVCPDKSQVWACNYSPRGNYIGEWPY